MDTSLDIKFAERSEAIVTQLGFKDLKSFVKNQASLMLMARIEKYEAESKRFEAKYHMTFKAFQAKVKGLQNEEGVFCGSSVVFTNIYNLRAEVKQQGAWFE